MASSFWRYVFASAALGGASGVFHGYTIGSLELLRDTSSMRPLTLEHAYIYLATPMARDGLQGALLGPWLPIWVPLSLTLWRDRPACPHFNRRLE